MKIKEMVKYKEKFIAKIRRFLINLFGKNKEEKKEIIKKSSIEYNTSITKEKNDKFINEIRDEEIIKKSKKSEFLRGIDGNVEKLSLLSVERLRLLKKYYEDVIKENEEKIKKLKVNSYWFYEINEIERNQEKKEDLIWKNEIFFFYVIYF